VAFPSDTQFGDALDLWYPTQPDRRRLWPFTVRLSDPYFQSTGRHAVPLDHRAGAAPAGAPMALDANVALAQRMHSPPGSSTRPGATATS
jgi:hypothetical protein